MILISAVELVMFRQRHLNVTEVKVDKAQTIVRPRIMRVDIECLLKSLYGLGVASYIEVDKP